MALPGTMTGRLPNGDTLSALGPLSNTTVVEISVETPNAWGLVLTQVLCVVSTVGSPVSGILKTCPIVISCRPRSVFPPS
jgi:hypothetical protein